MVSDKIYRLLKRFPLIQKQFRRIIVRLPHRKRLVTHFGQQLIIDPAEMIGYYLYYEKEYDNYIFNFLDSIAHKYERVLDIGANIGVYTVYFAKRFRQVDAFEPDPNLVKLISKNLEINHLKNVCVHEMCIGEKTGSDWFATSGKTNTGIGHISKNNAQGIKVRCTTLDDFIGKEIMGPLLIKMDIEGAEWLALQGAKITFRNMRFSLSILMEVHPREITTFGGDIVRLRTMFEEMGYNVKALTPEGLKELSEFSDNRFWWISHNQIE